MTEIAYRAADVDGLDVFYREAGSADAPVPLLLHGFANSSFYFRRLMPRLADRFRMIAPDLPSFDLTEVPAARGYRYDFASRSRAVAALVDAMGLERYVLYVFDYGAPVGFDLALAHPVRIEPESYTLDAAILARPGNTDLQIGLKLDYKRNIARYPLYKAFLRERRPRTLAVSGRNDPFFVPPGGGGVPAGRARRPRRPPRHGLFRPGNPRAGRRRRDLVVPLTGSVQYRYIARDSAAYTTRPHGCPLADADPTIASTSLGYPLSFPACPLRGCQPGRLNGWNRRETERPVSCRASFRRDLIWPEAV